MKLLVTGGAGLIGRSLLLALLRAGHHVRLLARRATSRVDEWPDGVESWDADVGDEGSIAGSAAGCEAVVHIAGIEREQAPAQTFARVNVEGTRHLVAEARRAGRPRFVFVSSLGADRGQSAYHRSKREAEGIVRSYEGDWRIVRPGNVYGPGDGVVSLLLRMVRTLPVVPVIDGGDQPFQPVWVDDLAEGLLAVTMREDVSRRVIEVAGTETWTMHGLLDELERVTGRRPARVPVPSGVASLGARVADVLGASPPVNEDVLTMLAEGNIVRAPEGNALPDLLGHAPTPLATGVRVLADALPEQLPDERDGAIVRKRYSVDVEGSRLSPEALVERVRVNFAEMSPSVIRVATEPGTSPEIQEGATLTLTIPLRGNVQVRCIEHAPGVLTLATVEGHPLAGAVRLVCAPLGDGEPRPGAVRIEIQVFEQAATGVDRLAMLLGGGKLQDAVWMATVRRVAGESGGVSGEVRQESVSLDGEEAGAVVEWLGALVAARRREAREQEAGGALLDRDPATAHPPPSSAPRTPGDTGSARTSGTTAPRADAQGGC